MSVLQSLISMGFSKERAEEALIETNNAGIDIAIEWLLVTDGLDTITNGEINEEENDYSKAEIASLGEHFEEAAVSIKETETTCETETASKSCESIVSSGNRTRILVRLLDGKTLSEVFNSRDKLNAVVSWIQLHINTKEFGLMTNFPKKVFTDEDYKQSLDALHLVPSAVLIVAQLEKWDNLKVYYGVQADDEGKKAEEKRRKEEIEKQFVKMEEERLALERVRTQIEDDKAARRQRWPNLYQNSDQPSGNELQNQPQTFLTRANRNQNHTLNKKSA